MSYETQMDQLFPTDLLRRMEALTLLARQINRGSQRAERRSAQRGSSVEFADYRQFSDGDDWRHIDWNAYARWRQLALKLYVEEEDLFVHLLLDTSRSMEWGSPVKYDYARQLAAGLALIALSNLDRAAIVPLAGNDPVGWRPTRGKHRFVQMLRYLADLPIADKPLPMTDAINRWLTFQPRRGLVIWLTDFWGSDLKDAFRALDRVRYSKHEVAAIQIVDGGETDPVDPGEFELEDMETGSLKKIILDNASLKQYQTKLNDYQESIREYCVRWSIPLLQLSTKTDPAEALTRALRKGGFAR
jgi:uncharacterized protein (DUF58 family)